MILPQGASFLSFRRNQFPFEAAWIAMSRSVFGFWPRTSVSGEFLIVTVASHTAPRQFGGDGYSPAAPVMFRAAIGTDGGRLDGHCASQRNDSPCSSSRIGLGSRLALEGWSL